MQNYWFDAAAAAKICRLKICSPSERMKWFYEKEISLLIIRLPGCWGWGGISYPPKLQETAQIIASDAEAVLSGPG